MLSAGIGDGRACHRAIQDFVSEHHGQHNLSLCSGTIADFTAGVCGAELATSGGPGFTFLAITNGAALNDQWLYVVRNVRTAASGFTITIE